VSVFKLPGVNGPTVEVDCPERYAVIRGCYPLDGEARCEVVFTSDDLAAAAVQADRWFGWLVDVADYKFRQLRSDWSGLHRKESYRQWEWVDPMSV
jgi:hypothetical protein